MPKDGDMKTRLGSIFSDHHFEYVEAFGRHPAAIKAYSLHGAKHSFLILRFSVGPGRANMAWTLSARLSYL